MSFQELELKRSYSSEKEDLLQGFYIPVLKEAISYRRITGYFSSSSFFIAARGFSEFIKRGGQLQFILNIQLSKNDYEQIEKGLTTPERIIENTILNDLDSIETACKQNHAQILGWLIARKQLEIKIGYIEKENSHPAIFHQKMGILQDNNENLITFVGSNNESASGWLHNSEKFKVFFNWESLDLDSINEDIDEFNVLWGNTAKKTRVIPFPDAARQHLIKIAPKGVYEVDELLNVIEQLPPVSTISDDQNSHVYLPKKTPPITLRQYQLDAIDAWFDNKCRGLFEMATGTGKTLTALGALKRLAMQEKKLVVIICCPFLHLVNQWEENLRQMDFHLPIIHASSINPKWNDELIKNSLDNRLGKLNQFIILTTHDTISSDKFIQSIDDVKSPILLIADEVHGMGSVERIDALLEKYNYRLGLSATPKRYFDELGTKKMLSYFDKTVYDFDLHRAINEINPVNNQSFLVPYDYYPLFAELNADEMELYANISRQIAIQYSKKKRTRKEELLLEKLLRDRQDILKNATEKYPLFKELIKELKSKDDISHTLVYCSPQQIQSVQQIIRDLNKIAQHKFTSEEDAIRHQPKYENLTEREYLLKNFDRGNYDVLVAIKCLDEGVDVPSTKNAILMCSSGNPKEYIQRRGRVLRRYEGKEKAIIYDMTAVPNLADARLNPEIEQKIFASQLKRLTEFAKDADNESDVLRKIFALKKKYGN
jgi:superfamily II DNA or RNA helicase